MPILIIIFASFFSLSSCINKQEKTEENISETFTETINTRELFTELNKALPKEKKTPEHYKNIILHHGISQGYLELADIKEVEYLIPGFFCFIASWIDFEGYVYKLYTFDGGHNIIDVYNCGNGWPFPYIETIQRNIPGEKFGDYLFITDINNDGINEILAFSFRSSPNFTVYGFDLVQGRFKQYLDVDYFFNFDEPFPAVKINDNNGIYEISILEITDKDTYDLQWFKYIFDKENRAFFKN